jgi:hypothetical protein
MIAQLVYVHFVSARGQNRSKHVTQINYIASFVDGHFVIIKQSVKASCLVCARMLNHNFIVSFHADKNEYCSYLQL